MFNRSQLFTLRTLLKEAIEEQRHYVVEAVIHNDIDRAKDRAERVTELEDALKKVRASLIDPPAVS